MADSRHRQVRKAPRSLRATHAILPVAGLLTVAAAGALVITDNDARPTAALSAATAAPKQDVFEVAADELPTEVNRSADRAPLTNEAAAEDQIEGTRFAVVAVEVHAAAKASSPVLAQVASGKTVDITGKTSGSWAQIIHKGLPRWVPAKSLAKEMPLGSSPCASGSGAERGLRPDTVKVHRAVCAKFPSIVRYGGVAGRGEHATGQALDIMVSSNVGNEVAAFLMEHRTELGIEYIIWRQRIWRPATSPNWRGMTDRGGATANHMDHVHVTTYGSSAQ